MPVAILASGQSLTPEQVSVIKNAKDSGLIRHVIAVSNVGIDLAPWADALVSHDRKWWSNNLSALEFKGLKFCRNAFRGVKVFIPNPSNGCNSGYMSMQVAKDIYKANKIILLGFDMHGTHYFGPHPELKINGKILPNSLTNTAPHRFEFHIKQFEGWNGCEVINCTPNSSLKVFPLKTLGETLLSLHDHKLTN